MLTEKLATVLRCESMVFAQCETEDEITLAFLEVCYLIMSIGGVPAVSNFLRKLEEQVLTPQEERITMRFTSSSTLELLRSKSINWRVVQLLLTTATVEQMQKQIGQEATWGKWWKVKEE